MQTFPVLFRADPKSARDSMHVSTRTEYSNTKHPAGTCASRVGFGSFGRRTYFLLGSRREYRQLPIHQMLRGSRGYTSQCYPARTSLKLSQRKRKKMLNWKTLRWRRPRRNDAAPLEPLRCSSDGCYGFRFGIRCSWSFASMRHPLCQILTKGRAKWCLSGSSTDEIEVAGSLWPYHGQ